MNKTILIGTISNKIITTTRTSGLTDSIPIETPLEGHYMVVGSLHTYNTPDRHLKLYVQPDFIKHTDEEPDNTITIRGFVCKSPQYRTTPNGRKITDLLIASPNPNSQSDYIPCIAWGQNAIIAAQYTIGTEVSITGRIQSRDYLKNNEPQTTIEISVTTIRKEE